MSANPLINPEAFDVVFVAGQALPGLARVEKPKRPFKWDKKEGAGTAGDTLTFRGTRTAEFTITLVFWLSSQIDLWDQIQPSLEPDPKNVKALDIVHPVLERLKIRSIIIESIGGIEHVGKGEFHVEIEINEYKPPPKANTTGTPDGSKNNGANGSGSAAKPPDALSEQEKEIAKLLKQAKEP